MEEVICYFIHGTYKCLRRFFWGNIEKIWQFRKLIKIKVEIKWKGGWFTFLHSQVLGVGINI